MFRNNTSLNSPEEHIKNSFPQRFSLPKLPRLKLMVFKTLTVKNLFQKKPIINPQEEQHLKLVELGTQLRQIRTEKGISLEMIAQETRIPLRLLKAIEAGEQENLPEPIYIRGLIKQFAEILGLDSMAIANTFPTQISTKPQKSYFNIRLPSLYLRPIHLYFLYLFLLMFSVRGIANILQQSTADKEFLTPFPQPTLQASPPQKTAPKLVKNSALKPIQEKTYQKSEAKSQKLEN